MCFRERCDQMYFRDRCDQMYFLMHLVTQSSLFAMTRQVALSACSFYNKCQMKISSQTWQCYASTQRTSHQYLRKLILVISISVLIKICHNQCQLIMPDAIMPLYLLNQSVDWFKRYNKNQYLGHVDLLFRNWSDRF